MRSPTLEAETVRVIREVAGQLERQALVTDGSPESAVLLELTRRAFAPGRAPFRVLERDGLEAAVAEHRLDALLLPGADGLLQVHGEDGAARERKHFWGILNARARLGQHVRVHPLAGWSAGDVRAFADAEGIELPDAAPALPGERVERGWLDAPDGFPDDGPGERARLAVQRVIRPMSDEHHDYRGYAGQVASGVLRPGDEVTILPSGATTTIAAIDGPHGELDEAAAGASVSVRLSTQVDVSRGDMICAGSAPEPLRSLEADALWLGERPLAPRTRLVVRHGTASVRGVVEDGALQPGERGAIALRTAAPLPCDPHADNPATARFVLVDEATNATLGAGLVAGSGPGLS